MSARLALAAALLVAAPAAAGPERIGGARLATRAAADPAPVVAALGVDGAEWVAWSSPGLPAAADLCCFAGDWQTHRCSLDERETGWGATDRDEAAPPAPELLVLVEVDRQGVRRVRSAGPSCPVAGAGRRVTWLEGVNHDAGLDLLESIADRAEGSRSDDPGAAAMAALAHLQGGVDRLVRLLREGRDREIRRQALFWLGQCDDPRALAEIERILASR